MGDNAMTPYRGQRKEPRRHSAGPYGTLCGTISMTALSSCTTTCKSCLSKTQKILDTLLRLAKQTDDKEALKLLELVGMIGGESLEDAALALKNNEGES